MNKKLLLLLLLAFLPILLFGQTEKSYTDGKGFKSVFQDLKTGKFLGTTNGILIIKDSDNQEYLLDFQGSYATLQVEKDEYEIHDVSYKRYTGKTTNRKSKIEYQTYGLANSLGVQFNGVYYEKTLLSGNYDLIINGLDYSYKAEKNTEYLILRVTKEIELAGPEDSIKIVPNSTIVFAVRRK